VKTLNEIAIEHGIKKLVFVKPGDAECLANGEDYYIGRSFIVGSDEIHLGIYEDPELLTISFFHELGHIFNNKDNQFNSESKAWSNGIYLAGAYGYYFSDKAKAWARQQLNTYSVSSDT
jgi:hypothetical protein